MHISKSTASFLEYLDHHIIPSWKSLWPGLDLRLKKALKKIESCRKDFDARLFFIVVFGPLKSGKSTLVNTLARQYVSPTRFARESTRRASIVIKGNRSVIQQFFWKSENESGLESDKKEAFDLVTQYLRGVQDESSLKEHVDIIEHPYDKALVDRLLAGPLENEPLITVIMCPGGRLIDEEIAVLDVPGLDGFQTNTENNPAAFWIIDKSDLLIFTQSSFAPLNNQTSKFLRDLYERSKKPPVLLAQNQIEARHWAPKEEQKQETEEQVSVARKEISELLTLQTEDLPAWPINLGKAHDGFFKKIPQLVHDSRFEKFESELQNYLESSRLSLHEKNCINELKGAVLDAESVINSLSSELDSALKDEQVRIALLRQCRENIQNLTYQPKWIDHDLVELESSEISSMKNVAEDKIREKCEELSNEVGQLFPGKSIKGKAINQLLYAASESLIAGLRKEIFVVNELLSKKTKLIFEAGASHIESAILSDTHRTLKNMELPPLPGHSEFDASKLPEFPGSALNFETYQESRKLLGFIPWPKKFPKIAIEEAIKKDLAGQWSQAVDELCQKWIQRFRDAFQEQSISTRQQVWISYLESHIIDQTSKLHSIKQKVAEGNESLDEIQTNLNTVKNRLLNKDIEENSRSESAGNIPNLSSN